VDFSTLSDSCLARMIHDNWCAFEARAEIARRIKARNTNTRKEARVPAASRHTRVWSGHTDLASFTSFPKTRLAGNAISEPWLR
jgi:hypothetical protein